VDGWRNDNEVAIAPQFYEPTLSVHRVAQNPSAKARTRLLAVTLHPRDIKDPTIREERKQ
jgi:hypothetical protein